MLQVLQFIFNCIAQFCSMLFSISIGNNMSLGLLMCIVFIFLPITHRVICFIKQDAMEELDDMYDSSRPRETFSDTYTRPVKFSDGSTVTYRHSYNRSRRRR